MADEVAKAKADGAKASRGERREKRAYHAPWETVPAHCLDLTSGHSQVDDMPLSDFWGYLAKPANTVVWKSECPRIVRWGANLACPLLCRFAGDDKRIGVATSRLAQMLLTAIGRLGSSGIQTFVNAQKLKEVKVESDQLVPHLKDVHVCLYILLLDDVRLPACLFRSSLPRQNNESGRANPSLVTRRS